MTTYSAVRTTGIYCRPGCGARPRAENVTTFELAAAAEAAGYRACLKCRPYRIAGHVTSAAPELVCRAVQLIIAGALDEGSEAALGRRLGISSRHLRRLFHDHVGATPTQLALSRRAHFARRLLDDSDLTIAEVAFASGFGSIRHFNRAMRDVFRSSPRDLRERRRRNDRLAADGGLTLRLPFDPPFDWQATLKYLADRAIPGVEAVDDGTYRRTIMLDGHPGVLEISEGDKCHLILQVHLPFWEGLIHVVEKSARMLGIDTDVATGEIHLFTDPMLAPVVAAQRGLRVPGAWGPFETAVETIASRYTLAGIVQAHGTYIPGLPQGLTHAFPSAETLAEAGLPGIVGAFAEAVATGTVHLNSATTLDELIDSLMAIPDMDKSVAQRIALRLGYQDAFPLGSHLEQRAERWRPWRGLAATHLEKADL
jgi:AraC family transcriptional regulator of adaptative response / DNA-3-methyladenine glycosylase II